jgi:hypothetical protein
VLNDLARTGEGKWRQRWNDEVDAGAGLECALVDGPRGWLSAHLHHRPEPPQAQRGQIDDEG